MLNISINTRFASIDINNETFMVIGLAKLLGRSICLLILVPVNFRLASCFIIDFLVESQFC